jgi:hypothetical protein
MNTDTRAVPTPRAPLLPRTGPIRESRGTPAPAPSTLATAPVGGALHVHIERLSLPGYTQAQSQRFVAVLNRAIAEFSAARGLASMTGGEHLARLDAGRLRAGATPEEAARQLAARLCSSLASNPGGTRHA